jgi:hypothetical protein
LLVAISTISPAQTTNTFPSSGNVGIGTTDPGSYKLNVNGYFNATGFQSSHSYPYTVTITDAADAGNVILTAGSTSGYVTTLNIAGRSEAVGGFISSTRNTERMRIADDGNVCIGTTDPGICKLNVFGKIRADEVAVNTSGADFVFETDYKLPELVKIEKYIKENKRLPDIPFASEMKENGMNLSEMQIQLLMKIEKLTFYAIEQN